MVPCIELDELFDAVLAEGVAAEHETPAALVGLADEADLAVEHLRGDRLDQQQEAAEEVQRLVLQLVVRRVLLDEQLAQMRLELRLISVFLVCAVCVVSCRVVSCVVCGVCRVYTTEAAGGPECGARYLEGSVPHVQLGGHLPIEHLAELPPGLGPHHPVVAAAHM
jgi:hypothetical protein